MTNEYKPKQRVYYIEYCDYIPYIHDALYMDSDKQGTWLSYEDGEDDLFLHRDGVYPNKTMAYESLVEIPDIKNRHPDRPVRHGYNLMECNRVVRRSSTGIDLYREAYSRNLYPYPVYTNISNKDTHSYITYLADKYKDIVWLESGDYRQIAVCGDLGNGVFLEAVLTPQGHLGVGYIDKWDVSITDYGLRSKNHSDIERALTQLNLYIDNRIDVLRDISELITP